MTYPTTITALPGLPFVDIEREFDAAPEAVFRAHTDPQLFARWTGPHSIQMDSVELDATAGGRWKFVFRGEGDTPFSFFGVFHTVEPNTLIVQTFEFNLAPGQAGISSTTFKKVDGRTHLSVHEVYPSVEARDTAVAMPRALKEFVGFRLSSFIRSRTPARAPRRGNSRSGVMPSPSVTHDVTACTGKSSRYRQRSAQ